MPFADLTTADAAQAWAGQPVSESLIAAASTQIQMWLGYAIASQAYSRRLNGLGGHVLMLPDRPITEVASVVIGSQVIPQSGSPDQPGFVFDDKSIALIGHRFCRGMQNVTVIYTAGYLVVPADIAQACLITIKAALDRAARESDVKSMRAGDTAFVYGAADATSVSSLLPADALALLSPYRRVAQC